MERQRSGGRRGMVAAAALAVMVTSACSSGQPGPATPEGGPEQDATTSSGPAADTAGNTAEANPETTSEDSDEVTVDAPDTPVTFTLGDDLPAGLIWSWETTWPEETFPVESGGEQIGSVLDNGCQLSTFVATWPTHFEARDDSDAAASAASIAEDEETGSYELAANLEPFAVTERTEFVGSRFRTELDSGETFVSFRLVRGSVEADLLASLLLACPESSGLSEEEVQALMLERAQDAVLVAVEQGQEGQEPALDPGSASSLPLTETLPTGLEWRWEHPWGEPGERSETPDATWFGIEVDDGCRMSVQAAEDVAAFQVVGDTDLEASLSRLAADSYEISSVAVELAPGSATQATEAEVIVFQMPGTTVEGEQWGISRLLRASVDADVLATLQLSCPESVLSADQVAERLVELAEEAVLVGEEH